MAENIDVTIVCPGPVVSEGAASAITHVVGEVSIASLLYE